jgi:hypothetical protein
MSRYPQPPPLTGRYVDDVSVMWAEFFWRAAGAHWRLCAPPPPLAPSPVPVQVLRENMYMLQAAKAYEDADRLTDCVR